MNLTIVRLNASHVDRLVELERICFSDPWSPESFQSELDHEYSRVWGYLHEEKVEGYLIGWTVFEEFHIANLAVAPDWRGRGIGKALVEYALAWAGSNGAETALLEVRASNTAANRLYRSLGFDLIAVRPRYYSSPIEDAWVLQKNLRD